MTTVFRLLGADFSGKGLPNVFPFVGRADLEYGFDFRSRANRLIDLADKHTITPKRVDQVGGVINVTDPTIITDADGGLGINVELGYLQCSLPIAAIPVDGSKRFTFMVVGGYSGIPFPAGKVSGSAPNTAILLDYGCYVSNTGFAIEKSGLATAGSQQARVESSSANLIISPYGSASQKTASFLTFDGTNWKLVNKTLGLSAAGTNSSLSVAGNPIAVSSAGYTNGQLSLGGHLHPTTTVFGGTPTLFQQAMWNRVLTDAEIEQQYQATKQAFSYVGV